MIRAAASGGRHEFVCTSRRSRVPIAHATFPTTQHHGRGGLRSGGGWVGAVEVESRRFPVASAPIPDGAPGTGRRRNFACFEPHESTPALYAVLPAVQRRGLDGLRSGGSRAGQFRSIRGSFLPFPALTGGGQAGTGRRRNFVTFNPQIRLPLVHAVITAAQRRDVDGLRSGGRRRGQFRSSRAPFARPPPPSLTAG